MVDASDSRCYQHAEWCGWLAASAPEQWTSADTSSLLVTQSVGSQQGLIMRHAAQVEAGMHALPLSICRRLLLGSGRRRTRTQQPLLTSRALVNTYQDS
jgi:hypothetical protein